MKKGDTLIEVILAFSVFAAAMMGAMWLMNSAMARAQGTLQLTMARNAMDGQAEMLRYLNNRDIAARANGGRDAVWTHLISDFTVTEAVDLSICPERKSDYPDGAFIINPRTMIINSGLIFNPADTYPRLVYNDGENDTNNITEAIRVNPFHNTIRESRGLWVQAVRSDLNSNFVDFHIRACWIAPGQGAPTTLGTIVRLYVAN